MNKTITLLLVGLLFFNNYFGKIMLTSTDNQKELKMLYYDFDPLVDINITFEILAIRALDKIDYSSDPDFFIKLFINNQEFNSPIFENLSYLYNCWTITYDVLDDMKEVNLTIQLYDWNNNEYRLCDISDEKNSENDGFDINLIYDISVGKWRGDDYNIGDVSGYGRVCGSGDGSIYQEENDCELWFNIYQNDYDNDGIPYWIEKNVYGTDPYINDKGKDYDFDGVSIEWEHRFGYNPILWEDHKNIDSDNDSINNIEEFLTFNYGSDPYRKDVFLEVDFMAGGPDKKNNSISPKAYELLKNPFHNRNIVFHIDSGEIYGGEIIPFDDFVTTDESPEIYDDFFIKNKDDYWRRGVFHYCIIVYDCKPAGYAFRGDLTPHMGYTPGTNSFIISSALIDYFQNLKLYFKSRNREFLYAANIMHEIGHNFGLRFGHPMGVDLISSSLPWRLSYWLFRCYKSVMNYKYTYLILDYSDGSHGPMDYDDWENIDLSYFENPSGTIIFL